MERDPLVEHWLDQWEEEQAAGAVPDLQEFVDRTCSGSQAQKARFRKLVRRLERMSQLIGDLLDNQPA